MELDQEIDGVVADAEAVVAATDPEERSSKLMAFHTRCDVLVNSTGTQMNHSQKQRVNDAVVLVIRATFDPPSMRPRRGPGRPRKF